MELAAYTELIKLIPCEDQAFETKRKTWEPYKNNLAFKEFYKHTFSNKDTVIFSRRDLFSFAETDAYKAIFAIILWGYPKGYTLGFNMPILFPRLLNQVEFLLENLKSERFITDEDFKLLISNCDGIGLSTLSKLLYFFKIEINKKKCLIMDSRIVRILRKDNFTELNSLSKVNEHNSINYYTDYLRVCTQLSNEYGYKPDQLELFLFMFGNNLKQLL